MKGLLLLLFLFICCFETCQYIESKRDPYEVGMHMDYRIICNDGYKYKYQRGATMPCLNSDGTPLKCNQKRY